MRPLRGRRRFLSFYRIDSPPRLWGRPTGATQAPGQRIETALVETAPGTIICPAGKRQLLALTLCVNA